ncbi:chromate efflux transporter [Sneathiella limimaris]|uniref:chromate efflux transporter n=1 Tax=Sneathiella limimaris TaxID=1964213 RepID=UPI00146E4153|nr:chromate efflux transporter [Sneathiella limimaris]
MTSAAPETDLHPSFKDQWLVFGQIGLQSFGGPAAQISLMHKLLVDDRKWLSENRFLNALNYCMLLPGPEAMQLATYAGWRVAGISGGLIAGLLFVLPGAAFMLALALIYSFYGTLPLIATLFLGIKAAVLVIVLEALLKVSKKALKSAAHWGVAGFAFIAIFFLQIPFPFIILAAALLGFFAFRNAHPVESHSQTPALSRFYSVKIIGFGLLIWFGPLLLLSLLPGTHLLTEIGIFFSKLAVVTFGGAYAVLAYMSQDVVSTYGWLTTGEMMDGLGLAETTPGPLILVTEFVAFLSAFKAEGLLSALVATVVCLWVTFVPCFIWIFAGAPYLERITSHPRLNGAFSAVTATVVGVILNLSVWFAQHVLFQTLETKDKGLITLLQPQFTTLQLDVVTLVLLNLIMLFFLKWKIGTMLLLSAGAAWVISFIPNLLA